MIEQLKQRWKGYKEKRFLETNGCKTWREYERRYDPDYGPLARYAHTAYHGYNCIWHYPQTEYIGLSGGWIVGQVDSMVDWCEKNCKGKWRNDWFRGMWDHRGNFEFNGIGGSDYMFFAFKEESDYMWFKLRWS